MTDELEDYLDQLECSADSAAATPGKSSYLEEQLMFSDMRQLTLAYLERRSIELGATERIENFCAKMHENGDTTLLQMRSRVLASTTRLLPRPLRLEILQMAIQFVNKFMPTSAREVPTACADYEARNGTVSTPANDYLYSDHSTSTTSSVEPISEFSRSSD